MPGKKVSCTVHAPPTRLGVFIRTIFLLKYKLSFGYFERLKPLSLVRKMLWDGFEGNNLLKGELGDVEMTDVACGHSTLLSL